MKPLQRYNIDTIFQRTWNNDGGEECLEIKESDNGEWVRDEAVRKLEKQNQMMLDAIKAAVNGYYSCPDDSLSTYHWRIVNELLEKTVQDLESQTLVTE